MNSIANKTTTGIMPTKDNGRYIFLGQSYDGFDALKLRAQRFELTEPQGSLVVDDIPQQLVIS